jgi:hypothetical protein
MSVKKFKFVSPGVFINEIDNSQLPSSPQPEGPTVLGRSLRGPAMRPVQVESLEELVEVFGPPIAGIENVDAFREPAFGAATYGMYAAEAWLRNSSTINFVRLLGMEHPNKTTDSGEAGWRLAPFNSSTGGGAWGVWVFATGSSALGGQPTGTLGAIIYCDSNTYVEATGTMAVATGASLNVSAADTLVDCTNNEFTLKIVGSSTVTSVCNFDRTSRKYIRTVLNTNPTKTTTAITPSANQTEYFVGETYDRSIEDVLAGTSNIKYVMVAPLDAGSAGDQADMRRALINGQSGWVISQDKSATNTDFSPENNTRVTKLFRFVGMETGEYDQSAVKISIENILPSKNPNDFGTFNVIVRRIEDNDAKIREVERFNSVNLNPNSPNYIARAIGDRNISWDNDARVWKEYGQYTNQSRYVRMEMAQVVDDGGVSNTLLPYGFYGPLQYANQTITSGSATSYPAGSAMLAGTSSIVAAARPAASVAGIACGDFITGHAPKMLFKFPKLPMRSTTAVGDVSSPQAAFFGMSTTRSTGSFTYDDSIPSFLRTKPAGISSFSTSATTVYSEIFTLDNLVTGDAGNMVYTSGSRASGASLTATSGSYAVLTSSLAPRGFTLPIFGGFDGLDITEKDPFAQRNTNGETQRTSSPYYSLTVAMDSIKDREVMLTNAITAPGITTTSLTDKMLDIAADRADCIALIDIPGGFEPSSENSNALSARIGTVQATVNNLNARNINSSYGCAYYPWVQIADSFGDANVWVPPTVVALGSFSYTDQVSAPWFAPAGFTRGGLSRGAGGVNVVGVTDRLRSKDRDDLYEANINPIGTFPNEGIVILGQKTLQVTRSALDRINVRRLLLYTKRHITAVANDFLFEQNVSETWNKFLGLAEPILNDITARFGLEEYKMILDETTTTPEMRDRNILYAKVFLKPAKSIEFIALDFVITNSAAVFE